MDKSDCIEYNSLRFESSTPDFNKNKILHKRLKTLDSKIAKLKKRLVFIKFYKDIKYLKKLERDINFLDIKRKETRLALKGYNKLNNAE